MTYWILLGLDCWRACLPDFGIGGGLIIVPALLLIVKLKETEASPPAWRR